MGDQLAWVRFDDGMVYVAWYASDPEYVVPLLFAREAAASLVHHGADAVAKLADLASSADSPSVDEPVTIWIDQGGGMAWAGRASRTAALLTSGMGPFASGEPRPEIRPGCPPWVDDALQAPDAPGGRRPLTHPAARPMHISPLAPARGVPLPFGDAEMVAAAMRLMDGEIDGLLIERMHEALLARAGDPPEDLERRLAPAVARAGKAVRSWDHLVSFVGAGLLELVGQPRNDDHLEFGDPYGQVPDPYFIVEQRCSEVMHRLRARLPGPLLSMPTEPSGALDPTALAGREVAETGEVMAHDRLIADLRSGRDTHRWPVLPDWSDPVTYSLPKRPASQLWVLSHREMGMAQSTRFYAGVFPLLWPHQPDRAVAALWDVCLGDIDREPSWSTPSVLAHLCTWLGTRGIPASAGAAASCTIALGSTADVTASAGQQLLRAHASIPAWLGSHVPTALNAAIRSGVIKPRRLATALASLITDLPAQVRDVTLTVVPSLIATGARDSHLLLAVAAEAAAAAGPAPAPPELVTLAERRGGTKAITEARRLLSLLNR